MASLHGGRVAHLCVQCEDLSDFRVITFLEGPSSEGSEGFTRIVTESQVAAVMCYSLPSWTHDLLRTSYMDTGSNKRMIRTRIRGDMPMLGNTCS